MTHRGASRPMRATGLLLLGVAAVAAVIGTASAVSGDGDPSARPPAEESTPATEPGGVGDPSGETSEPASEEPTESSEPTSSEKPTKPSTAPTSTGQAPGGGPGGSDGSGDSVKSVSVRVYNNSNVKGLANQAAEDLRARGWNVVEAGNYSGGVVYTTTAYYRPGTTEQAAAEAIGAEFGMRVEPRFEGIEDSSPGVIVIVTKDYQGAGKS